jgi:competence protein ComEA
MLASSRRKPVTNQCELDASGDDTERSSRVGRRTRSLIDRHHSGWILGDTRMIKRLVTGIAILTVAAGPVFAQATAPTAPARPAAPATAPAPAAAQPARPATPAAAQPAAAVRKININTATAAELDTLKGIGDARAKKIIEERAKAKFRNFDDLVKRNILPANVEAEIKDKISF